MADSEAQVDVVKNKHDAEFTADAAKYKEKCKEAHILEAELEVTNKKVGVVGDDNADDENDVDAHKCKVVAKPKAQVSITHVAFGDTADTATRVRSNNTVKNSTKSLSVKIKVLANMLKKKTTKHQDLV